MTDVWVVFIGDYSDRREVAAFDNEKAAIIAAEFLWQPDSQGRRPAGGVDVRRLPIQRIGIGASLDGGSDIWADGKHYGLRAGNAHEG